MLIVVYGLLLLIVFFGVVVVVSSVLFVVRCFYCAVMCYLIVVVMCCCWSCVCSLLTCSRVLLLCVVCSRSLIDKRCAFLAYCCSCCVLFVVRCGLWFVGVV